MDAGSRMRPRARDQREKRGASPPVTSSIRSNSSSMSRSAVTLLGVILLVAASLRLYPLRRAPPGFHVDEATVAWDAYCLLKTGHDASGARWPVFYTRGLGDNRSTPMIYATLPFQADRKSVVQGKRVDLGG